ncbi:hypothetical protein ABZX51_007295 [Aspergillus tubingensis]
MCSLAPAVTIRNYEKRNCRTIRGRFAACRNAAERACCDNRPAPTFSSSKFTGLPPTAIGSICTHLRGQNCGLVRDSGHGLSLCLNYPKSRGAWWFDCRNCRRPDQQISDLELAMAHKANTSVEPDMIGFDGHEFSINESTPMGIRDTLLAYFDSDTTYADIPEEYRIYEVFEDAED